MQIFDYADDWARFAELQMRWSGWKGAGPKDWGYACICMGERFEQAFRNNYEYLDQITGEHLHVFTFVRPPYARIVNSILETQRDNRPFSEELRARLEEIAKEPIKSKKHDDDPVYRKDKDKLRADLNCGGLKVDTDTVFIFFDMVTPEKDLDFDAIAAVPSPIVLPGENRVMELFKEMRKIADDSFALQESADQFVKRLYKKWLVPLAFKKTANWMNLVGMVRDTLSGRIEKKE